MARIGEGRRLPADPLEPPPSDARVNDRSLFSWHFEALRLAMLVAKPELAAALTRYETTTDAR